MRPFICLLLALLSLAPRAAAQQQDMPVPLDPKVKTGTLPNGLTYYIRHNEWPERRADFYIAQKVGSMQEEDNQRGLAHFLEHMCFNGTTHFPGDALKQYLERIGVKFGENLNAYTSFDETVYNINNVNVETAGAVDSCLLILHDWSHDLLLEDKEIDKERGVINEEWRMRRSAMMRMQEAAFPALYEGSKYGHRMPIGTMDVVMKFPYDDLRSYYRRWYRPDLQGLVIVGDVDPAAVEGKLKALFADIQPAAPGAAEREMFPVPDNEKPIISISKDKEQPMSYALLMVKSDPIPREMKGGMQYIVLQYIAQAACAMLNERLEEMTQKADAPFAQAGADYGEYLVAKTKDAASLTVVMKDGRWLQGMEAAYRELLRAQRGGFTQSEYDRFKQEYLSRLDAAYAARDKVENTSYVQDYVRHFLDNEPSPGIEWENQMLRQIVPAIPVEAVNQTIAQLPAANRSVALFLPDKEGVDYPTEQQVAQMLSRVEAEDIAAFTEEVNNDPLVPELESGADVRKIMPDVFGAKLVTLTNGMKIHVKQTDYAPNQISMQAVSWGGSGLYPNADYRQVSNATLVSAGGWGSFTATQLQKRLAGKQASAAPTIGDRSELVKGSCVKKDLETMLQLFYLCFTAPHRDDEGYHSAIARYRDMLKNQDLNPMVALQDSVASVVYGNNARAIRLRAEDLDALDYDRALEIYKERFANAGDFEFYLVGDLDADSVAPLLAKYLGALPVTKAAEKPRMIDKRITDGEVTRVFEKEQDTPNSVTLFLYHAPLKPTPRNGVVMSFLSQAMQMLFTETVREDEGGAYGVPTSGNVTDWPERIGVFQIQLPTAPEKLERMTQVIYQGVDRMCAEGPSQDYMLKIREYMLRSHAEELKQNDYWMTSLIHKTRYKRDDVTGYEDIVRGVTAEDVRRMANKVFKSGNRLVVGMKSPSK